MIFLTFLFIALLSYSDINGLLWRTSAESEVRGSILLFWFGPRSRLRFNFVSVILIVRGPIVFYNDLLFEEFEHLVLFLFFLPFLEDSDWCPRVISQYSGFRVSDLLEVLLEVEFAHLLLEVVLVPFCCLLREGSLTPQLGFLLVQTVQVLFLRFHDAFLSLLLFSFVVGTFLQLFEFLPKSFWFMLDDMKSSVGIVEMTGLTKSRYISGNSYQWLGIRHFGDIIGEHRGCVRYLRALCLAVPGCGLSGDGLFLFENLPFAFNLFYGFFYLPLLVPYVSLAFLGKASSFPAFLVITFLLLNLLEAVPEWGLLSLGGIAHSLALSLEFEVPEPVELLDFALLPQVLLVTHSLCLSLLSVLRFSLPLSKEGPGGLFFLFTNEL